MDIMGQLAIALYALIQMPVRVRSMNWIRLAVIVVAAILIIVTVYLLATA
jgi:hypothetical protein